MVIYLRSILGNISIRYGLVVRISGSHPGGPGSIPGIGNLFNFNYFNIATNYI